VNRYGVLWAFWKNMPLMRAAVFAIFLHFFALLCFALLCFPCLFALKLVTARLVRNCYVLVALFNHAFFS
jgi:hypothetical protein